jgi:hypothetical protein
VVVLVATTSARLAAASCVRIPPPATDPETIPARDADRAPTPSPSQPSPDPHPDPQKPLAKP